MSWATGYGFNFRGTLEYVTDDTDEIGWRHPTSLGDWTYPEEKISGVVAGISVTGSTSTNLDLDSGRDRRLAGAHQASNALGASTFRIDLPATGDYEIGLAYSSNISACRIELLDDTDSLAVLTPTISGNVADANGDTHSFANWPTSQTLRTETFTSTVLNVRIGNNSGSNSTRLHHIFVRQVGGASPTADSMLFTTQPVNTNVGSTMPNIVVSAVDSTDSDAVDTSYTGNITLAATAAGGYTGTLTRAAVAGVATFNDLVPQTIGTGLGLTATSSGLTSEASATFNITVPSGGGVTIPLEVEPMATPVLRNTPTASKRRVYMNVWNDDGTPWSGSVTGVKPTVAGSAGTEDIVRVAGALHYAQLTQPESDTSEPVITAVLAASGSRLAAQGIGLVSETDTTIAAPTTADIIAAEIAALDGFTSSDTALTLNSVAHTIARNDTDGYIASITAD